MGMDARTVSFAMEQALSSSSEQAMRLMYEIFIIIYLYRRLTGQTVFINPPVSIVGLGQA
jgi:hypothetical protein